MQSKARKLTDISEEHAGEDVRDCETENKRLMREISKDELHNYCPIINITGVITKRKMKETQRVGSVADITNSHNILVRIFERKCISGTQRER